jgi:hypothetical protein
MILSVQEIWDPALGSDANQRALRGVLRTFRVRTTSKADGAALVQTAVDPNTGVSVPLLFSFYVDANGNPDVTLLATDIDAKLHTDPTDWIVTVRYSNVVDNPEMAAQGFVQYHPLLRPAVPRWTIERPRRVAKFDLGYINPDGENLNNFINFLPQSGPISQSGAAAVIANIATVWLPPLTAGELAALLGGIPANTADWSDVITALADVFTSLYGAILPPKAIVNSAGQSYSPPSEVDDPRPTLHLTWNIPAPQLSLSDGGLTFFAFDRLLGYDNSVSSDVFLTTDPSVVKVTIDAGETHYEEGIYYLPVTAHFQFRPLVTDITDANGKRFSVVGWEHDEYVPDVGYYKLVDGLPAKHTDQTGLNPGGPYPLDGKGGVLRMPAPGEQQRFIYNRFFLYPRAKLNPVLLGVIVI